MKKILWAILAVLTTTYSPVATAQQACDWTGTWSSTYGDLKLVQIGDKVSGDFAALGTLKGIVGKKCVLDGTYDNVADTQKGHFRFRRNKEMFAGKWGFDGQGRIKSWTGNRISVEKPVLVKAKPPRSESEVSPQSAGQTLQPSTIYSVATPSSTMRNVVDMITDAKKTPSARTVFGCEANQLITVDKKGVWYKGRLSRGAMDIYNRANDAHAKGDAIRALALTPDCLGGVVVSDNAFTVKHYSSERNTQSGKPLRLEIWAKINDLRKQNKIITAIAFDPYDWQKNKSYVIVYDGGFDASPNIDPQFKGLLGKALRKGPVYSVGFYPRKGKRSAWVILGENGFVFTSNGSTPKLEHEIMLHRLISGNIKPTYANFAPYVTSKTTWAVGTNDCEVSNTVTQRASKSCKLNIISMSYKRADKWQYDCPKDAKNKSNDKCKPYYTSVGLFDTAYTPEHWIKGIEKVEVQVCDPSIVTGVSGTVTLRYVNVNAPLKTIPFSSTCKVYFDATKGTGKYILDIDMQGRLGSPATIRQTKREVIDVEDIWVVILGDSYASGEGASFYGVENPAIHEAKWLYDGVASSQRTRGMRCNASPIAWGAKAAEFLSKNTPHYGVKVSNFACSGSKLTEHADIRKGTKPKVFVQMDALANVVRRTQRQPDFVLFTIGGNDAKFSDIIQECLSLGCDEEGDNDKKVFASAKNGLAALPKRFKLLNDSFNKIGIPANRIIMPSYFDPTQGSDGSIETCFMKEYQISDQSKKLFDKASSAADGYWEAIKELDKFNVKKARKKGIETTEGLIRNAFLCPDNKLPPQSKWIPNSVSIAAASAVTEASLRKAVSGVGEDLHQAQNTAAREHQWFFVDNARDVYKKHGNCAAEPYTNRICEAVRRTGDYNGSFHPNKEGHEAAGLVIGLEMVAHFKNQTDSKKYFE